ncbi:MAG: sulfatase-like hydrolase/transferase [Opitutaceae bacterium]|nr:sulfatase-like hydrolase/transferase [Opitutaceae bacterium]
MKPTRRQFIRRGAIGAAATFSFPALLRSASARRERPNLLFLWTDQQRADTLACYGNARVQAPHLNALAAQSTVFDRAYVSHPVCTPSRSSVMTGLWPHQSGCTGNNIALRRETPCFPELLRDRADYATGYIGKWHLGDELFAQHGFNEWAGTEDGYGEHFSAGRDREARSAYHHWLIGHGHKPDKRGTFSRDYAVRVPVEFGKPSFQAGRACEFLDRHRREPFVLHVNYLEPHTPYRSPLNGINPPEALPIDPSCTRDDDPEQIPMRYRLRQGPPGNDEAKLREIRTHYLGNVTCVDRSVGRILARLEQHGLTDNTVIVFTSDHGDQLGAHQLMGKSVLYEESVRVPCFIKVPGGRGHRVASPWSHIDFVPTLLELMGQPVPENLPGRSRAPEVRGESAPARNAFAQWSFNRAGDGDRTPPDTASARAVRESSRTVITPDGWKLCLSDVDRCLLFNRREDPYEQRNLFYRGAHREVIARLTKEIHAWQQRTADKLAVG